MEKCEGKPSQYSSQTAEKKKLTHIVAGRAISIGSYVRQLLTTTREISFHIFQSKRRFQAAQHPLMRAFTTENFEILFSPNAMVDATQKLRNEN